MSFSKSFLSFLRWSLRKKKKTLQKAKKLFKVSLLSLLKIRSLIFLGKPLEFLPVHSRLQAWSALKFSTPDHIFFPRKGYDSVSTSASFSFKQSWVKIWKGKVNIPVLRVYRHICKYIQSKLALQVFTRQCDAGVFLSLVFGKMIWCRHVCYHICRKNYSFSLRQNILNLCQSIFVFLTVYYDKIFKHWLESSSIRSRVKMLKDKVKI